MNNYNPYTNQLLQLNEELRNVKKTNASFFDLLLWYDNTSTNELKQVIQNTQKLLEEKENRQQKLLEEQKVLTQKILKREQKKKTTFGISTKKKVREEQKQIKNQIASLLVKKNKYNENLEQVQEQIPHLRTKYSNAKGQLKKYNSIDKMAVLKTINENKTYISQLTLEIENIEKRKTIIDDTIEYNVRLLQKHIIQIESSEHRIDLAQEYNERLSDAENSFERREIHIECENKLGDGNPKKIIQEEQKKLKSLERDYNKLEQKIERDISRIEKYFKTEHLIIDGNNLCYRNSNWIGFAALKALERELIERDYDVTIVFDNTISYQSKTIRKDILKQFQTKDVVISSGKADETILKLANNNENTFIVSNDKFIDFLSEEVIQAKRIFKHEITQSKVFIHDLDIDVQF